MKKFTAAVVLFLAFTVTAAFSFLAGELVGMKSGYAHSRKMEKPLDAAYLVSVLGLMENGMYGEAAEMLEVKLDTHILEHRAAQQCRLTGLNPFLRGEENRELFYPAITHRASRPSGHESVGEHLRAIEEELEDVE